MAAINSGYQKGTTADPSMARRVLAVVSPQVQGAPAQPASFTVGDLVFETLTTGTAANGTASVAIVVAGNNTVLSVSVSGGVVTVNSATDGSGNATSTNDQVVAAVQASGPASALVNVHLATRVAGEDSDAGSEIVSAVASTPLANAAAETVGGVSDAPLPVIPPIANVYSGAGR